MLPPWILCFLWNHVLPSAGELYCQNEVLTAACSPNEVIVMTSAIYGRMDYSRCVERDYGYIGCKENVLRQADVRCSGRRSCQLHIPNPLMDARSVCPNDLKEYLDASYVCAKVLTGRGDKCISGRPLRLEAASNVLSSALSEESRLGTADCPWAIEAKPGQRIKLALTDFGLGADVPGSSQRKTCQAYAIVREDGRSETLCGGQQRQRDVFESATNRLELRMLTNKKDSKKSRHFLITYKVVGCPSPGAPVDGWVTVDGGVASFGCRGSKVTWSMTCDDALSEWDGETTYNCTSAAVGELLWQSDSLTFGLSVFIIVIIALAIGVVILLLGLFVLKWKRRRLTSGAGTTSQYAAARGKPDQKPAADDEAAYASENEYAYISEIQPLDGYRSLRPYSDETGSHAHGDPNCYLAAQSCYSAQSAARCPRNDVMRPSSNRHLPAVLVRPELPPRGQLMPRPPRDVH